MVMKTTKAPAKETLTPTKSKRFKMVPRKNHTLLVDSSSYTTAPQAEDNPHEIIFPPSVNKAQEIVATQGEITQAFKAPEPAPTIPKPAVDLDAYFEVLSQKTIPIASGASGSGTTSSSRVMPSSNEVEKAKMI
ncbi:hypothetical protein CsSME_00043348 [Camellia sinensis var. sinensis]